jgi:RND family efflux transporter MFP subunit
MMKKLFTTSVFTFVSTSASSLVLLSSILAVSFHANAYTEKQAQLVSVDTVKEQQVKPSIWLPANVISRKNAPISAEQTGQLLWIEDVGTSVEKGQLLAQIDDRNLKLQLARQQAQVKQHQADVTYFTQQKNRISKLREKNNSALSELERTSKDLTVAINEVAALKSLVAQTELALEKTKIVAPFNGHVSERFAHVGELISVGRSLVQLVDTKNLDIKIAAPINIAPFLQKDANVMVKWQNKLIELPIRTWSQAGNQLSRTFDVRLSANNVEILAGSAVMVSLPKERAQSAMLVPRDALLLRENETYVLTVNENEEANKVSVIVGQGVDEYVSVIGNLSLDDQVIIRGGERLQSGQKVRFNNELIAKIP